MTDSKAPREMLRTEEALEAMAEEITPIAEHEEVALFDALGRILAQDLIANRTMPPAPNSAMDGYAVRAADLISDETRLLIGGRITAGHVFDRPHRPGEALRIFTGAEMPKGADTVVMQEDARPDEGFVWLKRVEPGVNVRPAGEDFAAGEVILDKGRKLLPQDIGLAAAAGFATFPMMRRLKVAFFATGDEVREPGADVDPGTIVNSNSFSLHGLIRRLGAEPVYLGILHDKPERIRAALAEAASGRADAIITTGGVSAGEEDHVKAAVEALGTLSFWRIAMRPGRPLAFGRIGSVPFLGLPGNPVAAMVAFLIFARPLLLRLGGATVTPVESYPVKADFTWEAKKAGRREWLRGHLIRTASGELRARIFPHQGSGVFTSMVRSTGLIDLAQNLGSIEPGMMVEYIPFSALLD